MFLNTVHPIWGKIDVSEACGSEIEDENEMNLLFNLKREQLGHPQFIFPPDTGAGRPSVLFLGDSYFWGMRDNFKIWNSFSSGDFIYYYRLLFAKGKALPIDFDKKDMKSEIDKSDIIVLESSEVNYPHLGWGAIDDMYGIFKGRGISKDTYYRRLNEIKAKIKGDPDWFRKVELKAKTNSLTVDSMLTLDAIWVMEH